MTVEELEKATYAVEDQLIHSPTKRTVVQTLANLGICSAQSSGIEKTLWNALGTKKVNRGRFPQFYRVMMGRSVPSNIASKPVQPGQAPAAQPAAPVAPPKPSVSARGFSVIEVGSDRTAKVHSPDGQTVDVGNFDASAFDSSLSLTEFRV
jgi:hypothetical protein